MTRLGKKMLLVVMLSQIGLIDVSNASTLPDTTTSHEYRIVFYRKAGTSAILPQRTEYTTLSAKIRQPEPVVAPLSWQEKFEVMARKWGMSSETLQREAWEFLREYKEKYPDTPIGHIRDLAILSPPGIVYPWEGPTVYKFTVPG